MMGRNGRMLAVAAMVAAACSVCWVGQPKWGERFGQARRLIREGKLAEAEKRIDALLEEDPLPPPQRLEADELRGLVRLEARKLAAPVVTARRGSGTPHPARVAAFTAELRASRQWPLIEPQIRAHEQGIADRLPGGYVLPRD